MTRNQRYDYPGAIHHIFVRGNNKQNIFIDDEDKGFWIHCLEDTLKKTDGNIHAFGINDNHNHSIYESGNVGISKFMHTLETKYAAYFKKKYNYAGHVFQGRFGSALIQEDDVKYFITGILYVIRNPLVAGVCEDLLKYKFTSLNSYFKPKQYNFVCNRLIKAYFNSYEELCDAVLMNNNDAIKHKRIKEFYFYGGKEFIENRIKEFGKGERIENRAYQKIITPDDVEKFIEKEYGYNFLEMSGQSKQRKYTEAKNIAVYLLYTMAHQTHSDIKKILGFSSSDISRKVKIVEEYKFLSDVITEFKRNGERRG